MNQEIQNTNSLSSENNNSLIPADVIESLVLNGDLSQMTSTQKVKFYNSICNSMGLNPMTQPFEIIPLKGKLKMYAKKDATDQLRRIYGVSVTRIDTNEVAGIYMATAYVKDKFGREDSDTGAVSIANLQGENLANAIMKATTKAKRRATLSICGLGMLDESEIEPMQIQQEDEVFSQNVNIDIVDPHNPDNINKYGPIAQMIFDQRVPESLFQGVGQTREEFLKSFGEEFNSGNMPVGKADQILLTLQGYCK